MNFMVFIQEKPKFYREQESELYGVVPYFFSKIIIEIPLQFIISIVNFLFLYFILGLNDHDTKGSCKEQLDTNFKFIKTKIEIKFCLILYNTNNVNL